MVLAIMSEQFKSLDMRRQASGAIIGEDPEVDLSHLVVQELFQVAFIVPLPTPQAHLIKRSAISAVRRSLPLIDEN